ncbi:secreted glycosidase, partial [Penicillium chermesinum]
GASKYQRSSKPIFLILFVMRSLYLPLLLASSRALAAAPKDYDVLQYIDPLIGTANGGNVFAGASLPYGMAKAVADTDSESNQGGFAYDGSNSFLGNFPLFAYPECAGDDVDGCVFPKLARKTKYTPGSVKATPGYFSIGLESGVNVDMTAAQHTTLFRFNFTKATSPLVFLDLTDLSDSRQDNATISVNEKTGRMTGTAKFLPSFGSGTYDLSFCADFKSSAGLRDSGIFVDARASAEVHDLKISRGINGYPLPGGGFVRFKSPSDGQVQARVGLSFISSDQACSNAESEIPDFDFEKLHQDAIDQWTEKLKPIRVSRNVVHPSVLTNFYSGIYRTMVNPQNYTGENPLWSSEEPYFDSFYCLWDSFRSQFPFLTLVDPSAVAEMIRSMIETQRHLGWLPDCRMSLCKGYTQGGSNADNILADAYVKGLANGINWDDGYAAVKKDAEEEPFDWSNEGRGGLVSWKSKNYIPVEDFDYLGFGTMTRSISRTLEYSYNNFAIAQIARGLGKSADVEKYEESSGYWKNLYKKDQESFSPKRQANRLYRVLPAQVSQWDLGISGPSQMLQYRHQRRHLLSAEHRSRNLRIQHLGILIVRPCNPIKSSCNQSYSHIPTSFVPHDMAALITLFGGPAKFVSRLDYLHDNNITYIGNEPAFLTVYQYHYAGRPAKSTARVRTYIPDFFAPTPTGLPGNDDSGAMGSFVAIALLRGRGHHVPVTGKTATIRVLNFEKFNSANNTGGSGFIQSATLNGEPYTKNWVDHDFFTEGKSLVLVLGKNESSWGTGPGDLPPSLSTQSSQAELFHPHAFSGEGVEYKGVGAGQHAARHGRRWSGGHGH